MKVRRRPANPGLIGPCRVTWAAYPLRFNARMKEWPNEAEGGAGRGGADPGVELMFGARLVRDIHGTVYLQHAGQFFAAADPLPPGLIGRTPYRATNVRQFVAQCMLMTAGADPGKWPEYARNLTGIY